MSRASLLREAVARLRAYWRAERNGRHAWWGVCPVCREAGEPSLGIGTYPDGSLRAWCWREACGALEEHVCEALGLPAPRRPGSGLLHPPEVRVPAIRAPGE